MAGIEGMDPWEIDQILQTLGSDEERQLLLEQLAQAQALRGQAGQTPATIQAGRVVVPNIGGAISGGIAGYKGRKDELAARDALADLGQKKRDASKTYFKALTQTPEERMRKAGLQNLELDEEALYGMKLPEIY